MAFQNTPKDFLEAFLALWRLINKRTLYYDTLARVTWPSEARWIAVYQGRHNTPLLLSLLRSSITQAGKSIEMNQNMAACLLFLAILGVFTVISQNDENCQVLLMAHKYKNRTIIYFIFVHKDLGFYFHLTKYFLLAWDFGETPTSWIHWIFGKDFCTFFNKNWKLV